MSQQVLPTFATREEAEEWMEREVDDPCVDCERFAYVDDPVAFVEYYHIQEQGCCGFFDADIIVGGRRAMLGCNYGH